MAGRRSASRVATDHPRARAPRPALEARPRDPVRLLRCRSHFVAAAELCRQQGLLVEGQKHNPVRNPSWLFRDAASMVVALGKELGLTPNARGRMRVPEAKESLDDLFD